MSKTLHFLLCVSFKIQTDKPPVMKKISFNHHKSDENWSKMFVYLTIINFIVTVDYTYDASQHEWTLFSFTCVWVCERVCVQVLLYFCLVVVIFFCVWSTFFFFLNFIWTTQLLKYYFFGHLSDLCVCFWTDTHPAEACFECKVYSSVVVAVLK